MNPIIIIGSGLAGYTLARELRKKGVKAKITIVTRDPGYYYSKPLLSRALTNKQTADALKSFTKEQMAEQLNASVISETTVLSIQRKKKQITLDSQEILKYSKLVLAVGAQPLVPEIEIQPSVADQVQSVNNLEHYQKFRQKIDKLDRKYKKDKQATQRSVVILGAGLVGCEFANDLLNHEYQVTIIAKERFPLKNLLPEPAASALLNSLKKRGVRWLMEDAVEKVTENQDRIDVTTANGYVVTADAMLLAIGLKSNTDLAKDAGLEVNQGIVVDSKMTTSDSAIYAVGDCAEVQGRIYRYVAPINYCIDALVKTISGNPTDVAMPALAVSVKTPACPVAVSSMPPGAEGDWDIQAAGDHVKAVFLDNNNKLLGFALTGDRAREKSQLLTLLARDE